MALSPLSPPESASFLRSLIVDLAILGGVGLLAYGAWLIFPPAAFIVVGFVLITAGVNGARR